MWILFSPSEKKCLEHAQERQTKKESFYQNFICNVGLKEALSAYVEILQSGKESEIKQIFGVKNLALDELAKAQNLMHSPLLPAVLRYIGVAFNALDFGHLESKAQNYLKEHLLIFSNLFGVLRANDEIPYYDLKQGEGFQRGAVEFNTKKFYLQNSKEIWNHLSAQKSAAARNLCALEILDLRAGFYQKCFDLGKIPPYFKEELQVYEPNFKKDGKVVSHYAKHYRGILLKTCAKENLKTLKDLSEIHFEGLELESSQVIQEKKLQRIVLTYAVKSK